MTSVYIPFPHLVVRIYPVGVLQWRDEVNSTLSQVPFSVEQITEYFLTNEMIGSSDIPEPDPVASLILDLAHTRTDENTSCYEIYNQLIQYATFKGLFVCLFVCLLFTCSIVSIYRMGHQHR